MLHLCHAILWKAEMPDFFPCFIQMEKRRWGTSLLACFPFWWLLSQMGDTPACTILQFQSLLFWSQPLLDSSFCNSCPISASFGRSPAACVHQRSISLEDHKWVLTSFLVLETFWRYPCSGSKRDIYSSLQSKLSSKWSHMWVWMIYCAPWPICW